MISVQINWESGVEMTLLKRIFPPIGLQQENLSLKGKEACHRQLLV